MASITAIRPCISFAPHKNSYVLIEDALDSIVIGRNPVEHFVQVLEKMHIRVGYLLRHGDEGGKTIIHKAAAFGNETIIRGIFLKCKNTLELLSLGSKEGLIPLHSAASKQNVSTAHALISLGSPINVMTTMTIYALAAPSLYFVKVPKGATPLDIALKINNFSMILLLRINGGRCALPLQPHQRNHLDAADALIAQKQEVLDQAVGQYLPLDTLRIISGYAINFLMEWR